MVLARGGGRNEAVSFPGSRDVLAHDHRSLRLVDCPLLVCGIDLITRSTIPIKRTERPILAAFSGREYECIISATNAVLIEGIM